MDLERCAADVVQLFPLTGTISVRRHRGGFSGACVWQVHADAGAFCLRAWPADVDAERVRRIHNAQQRARRAGLDFVPMIMAARNRQTRVVVAARVWDLTTWMTGQADFHANPTPQRLENACAALARLHDAWHADVPFRGPCPAVQRRLHCLDEWERLLQSRWAPPFEHCADVSLRRWSAEAWRRLQLVMPFCRRSLQPWASAELPLQPCLCDIWHDHVLFQGDTVTGVVDYGSVKQDHVAVDLARLLGSLVGDDAAQRSAGLMAYRDAGGTLAGTEAELVDILDRTGTICGAANWLRWLFVERRTYEDLTGVARRLAALVTRMENWC